MPHAARTTSSRNGSTQPIRPAAELNRPQITGLNFYNDASACTRADQTITFEPVDKVYGDADFILSATASSGLPGELLR